MDGVVITSRARRPAMFSADAGSCADGSIRGFLFLFFV